MESNFTESPNAKKAKTTNYDYEELFKNMQTFLENKKCDKPSSSDAPHIIEQKRLDSIKESLSEENIKLATYLREQMALDFKAFLWSNLPLIYERRINNMDSKSFRGGRGGRGGRGRHT